MHRKQGTISYRNRQDHSVMLVMGKWDRYNLGDCRDRTGGQQYRLNHILVISPQIGLEISLICILKPWLAQLKELQLFF